MRWPYRISLLAAGLAGLAWGSEYDVTNKPDFIAGMAVMAVVACFLYLTADIMRED